MTRFPRESHFVDTSIFMSIIRKDRNKKKCGQYFARVKQNMFKAYVSPLVVGEAGIILHRELKEPKAFIRAVSDLRNLLDLCSLTIPRIKSTYSVHISRYSHLESRCSSTDIRIICEAISGGFDKLITLETKINSQDVNNVIEIVDLSKASLW